MNKTPNQELGEATVGSDEPAVDHQKDKVGHYDDQAEVKYPGGATAPKTHDDPFTLGG